MTIIVFLITLSVLVLAHELGHFTLARLFKMPVEEFGIGFPPRAWSWVRNGIRYSLNWLPLGGFVKIIGEDSSSSDPLAFINQKRWKRFLVLFAGVFMNFLVGWAIVLGILTSGVRQPLANKVPNAEEVAVQIVNVAPGTLAEQLGLRAGDEVLAVDGQALTWADDLKIYLQTSERHEVTIRQEGMERNMEVVFQPGQPKVLGVGIVTVGVIKYSWYELPMESLKLSFGLVKQMFQGLGEIIKSAATGAGTVDVAGPVGVAAMTGQAYKLGWLAFLQFVAFLSFNLAVINVLPIPALDGGRILFLTIETIRRKASKGIWEQRANQIAFMLLLLLILLVTIKDIKGLW
ncbi:MAG: M50 family metallopeptidase [bacterium]